MTRETLVSRFVGSEIEYGFRMKASRKLTERFPKNIAHSGTFLQNGGRLYRELEFFAEYDTPECGNPEDLVTYELAGEQLAWDTYKTDTNILSMHKRAISVMGMKSSGAHENYSTDLNIWDDPKKERLKKSLAVHFATRTCIIGAGEPTAQGYHVGQKILHLEYLDGTGNTSAKALINTRNEPHRGKKDNGEEGVLNRLHVVCGDANISPWTIKMKFATTSLVLRLLEHGVDISDLLLHNPLDAAKTVAASEQGMHTPLQLASGEKTMTALEIQYELAKRAQTLSEKIDIPERKYLPEWFSIIDALKRYSTTGQTAPELEQLDWYAKKSILEIGQDVRDSGTQRTARDPLLRKYVNDLRYDMIPNGIGIRLREPQRVFGANMPERTSIESAYQNPPELGRARLRGALIKNFQENVLSIDWASYRVIGRPYELGTVDRTYTGDEVKAIVDKAIADKAIYQKTAPPTS